MNKSQNHSLERKIDGDQTFANKSIKISENINMLNDYEKLSTTYHEYIRGIDINHDIEDKGRNRSKRKFKKNISDAKKRLSRLKRLSDLHEKGLVQTVSPDITIDDPLMRNSMNSRFLKSNDSVVGKPQILNCATSMSVSPISRTITPASIVKSTFGSKKKKLILGAKIGSKGMKCFTINTSLSKHNTKPTDRNKSSRSGISNGSIHRSSGKDLDKVSSLINKLKEANSIKEKLAVHNQTLKFNIAELQKEKYSLSQLNRKLSEEVQK